MKPDRVNLWYIWILKPNYYQTMVDITTGIRELNNVNPITNIPTRSFTAPTFHTWGKRSKHTAKVFGPQNLLEWMGGVKTREWREDEMRHLKDRTSIWMGMSCLSCVRYFKVLYSIIPCNATSKKSNIFNASDGSMKFESSQKGKIK